MDIICFHFAMMYVHKQWPYHLFFYSFRMLSSQNQLSKP